MGIVPRKKIHGHLIINSIGVVSAGVFTAANIGERDVCPSLAQNIFGLLIGDKGYLSSELKIEMKKNGVYLETHLRNNMDDNRPKEFIKWIMGTRRLVETVIGQLSERFHIEKVRAKDIWHQTSRFWRKLLAHTVCVRMSVNMGNEPLEFERLVA